MPEFIVLNSTGIDDVRKKVDDKINECIDIIQSRLGLTMERPIVTYDLQGRTAGQAWGSKKIRLNLQLLMKNTEDMISDTVPHEFAHLVVSKYWPKSRAHGTQWASICHVLGIAPKRCHQYETTPARTHKKYAVTCSCQTHYVTRALYLRIQDPNKRYYCKKCKGDIR